VPFRDYYIAEGHFNKKTILRDLLSFALEPIAYFISSSFIFFHSRKHKQIKVKVLYVYHFLATLLMVNANLDIGRTNNIEIHNILCLITFVSLGLYFYYSLTAPWKKKLVVVFALIGAGHYIITKFLNPSPVMFDSLGQVILSISVLIMVFLFMHQILTNVTEEPLSLNFDFWFVSAQLMYYLAAFFIFLTFQYLTKKVIDNNYSVEDRKLLTELWGVHNVILFLSSIIIATSVVWIYYRKKSPSSS
jgi:hypothetical protein